MDLVSELSAHVEDNEVVTTAEGLGNDNETKIVTNGTCHDTNFNGVGVGSPSAAVPSPGDSLVSPLAVSKGHGLRKWRRIRREGGTEVGSSLDGGKQLKRGFSNPVGNSNTERSLHISSEMIEKSEGSVSSTNAVVKVLANGADGIGVHGGDSGYVGGPIFAAGTESENSEDRSSRSSTAASAPRSRYEIPSLVGYGRDKNKMKSLSGKNLNSSGSGQRSAQQGKGQSETTKKARGDRVKIEKENSHSSMESDSRSSNFVFMQGTHSANSNGRQSGRSADYDGENSDDAQDGEQHFNEDLPTAFSMNEAESEDASQEDLAAEHGSSMDQDPLIESIVTLQSVQEALEKEVEKFRYIGKDDTSHFDDLGQAGGLPSEFAPIDPEVHDPCSSNHDFLENQMIGLKQNVVNLENKLEEARIMCELKEAKVVELEAILNSSKPPEVQRSCTTEVQMENQGDLETELEGLIRLKIEAEIEYLVISKTIQTMRVAVVDRIKFLGEQAALASKQATKLERRAEKLESSCGEIVEADEVLKLQTRVCKFTSCFVIQLILLLVLGVFLLQLSPHYGDVVPT